MSKTIKKKYKIMSSFNYKGPDGKKRTSVRIGPGEEVPKLDSDELGRLLALEKIAEVSSQTGEVIRNDKSVTITGEQINRFLMKSPNAIAGALKSTNFSTETLGQMVMLAERNGLPTVVKNIIEEQLNARIALA